MEYNDIKQLALLMKEMGLTSLEYSDGEASVKMERGQNPSVPDVNDLKTETAAPQTDAEGIYTVTSPMVGVFYAAPAADKQPYVSIGDRVNAGDVLCIIEAMKMMNEITAEKGGVIREICVGNKQIVEYGHPLFRIKLDT
ncbi:MAG: acetyl-CoA carboxylase biotin carboxyl carrier protein [Clostridiales bacterium]|jgi:acetyl-CoA carboxylase biotin carboxyl carrier protein|nr:acetyl-CoA carboxylase biotin carboxyl carrier protein [Clostridiales bacterium]